MARRFLASLLLWTCLLGIVQPAFACASRSDCCPTGSTGGCGGQPGPAATSIGTDNCCAVQANAPSPASVRARPDQAQLHAPGVPVAADATPGDALSRDRRARTSLPGATADTVFDQSLTYLHTGRLRL